MVKIFGPVPSRRLGNSLGINNIPPKICSYGCIYCQLGRTKTMQIHRENFYDFEEIVKQVHEVIDKIEKKNEMIDYLTFVADGEPTLDLNLGQIIKELKVYGIKVAVISNASLIDRNDVREDLAEADWVSLKCDALNSNTWHEINRPYGKLDQEKILDGMIEFSRMFSGTFATETMLVKGVNDNQEEFKKVAGFLQELKPDISYIAIPTRPPAEENLLPPDVKTVNLAYQIFMEMGIKTEYLIGYEGNQFSSTGDIKKDLLSITAVHPLRRDAIEELLKQCDGGWNDVVELINEKKIIEIKFEDEKFYLRAFK